jgi:hypothetical protein
MVATLYDASLDAYLPHHWMQKFNVFPPGQVADRRRVRERGPVPATLPRPVDGGYQTVDRYRKLPDDITVNMWGYMYFEGGPRGARFSWRTPGAPAPHDRPPEVAGLRRPGNAPATADQRHRPAAYQETQGRRQGRPARGPKASRPA